MEYIEYINNYEELKSHIGEILLFSYGSDKSKHTWMKKVTNVTLPDYFPPTEIENAKKTVCHHFVYGTHSILLEHEGKPSRKLLGKLNEDRMSNAQEIVRTPTKEEMKIYMNTLRKYRVFGNN
jgi:hypothetical protein